MGCVQFSTHKCKEKESQGIYFRIFANYTGNGFFLFTQFSATKFTNHNKMSLVGRKFPDNDDGGDIVTHQYNSLGRDCERHTVVKNDQQHL